MAMVMLMVIVIMIVIVIIVLVIVILIIVIVLVRVIGIVIVLVIVIIMSIIVIGMMIGIVLVMIGIGTEIGVGNCLRGLKMSPSVASRGPIWEPGGPGHIKISVFFIYKFCARPDDATFSVPPRRPVLGLFQERFYRPDGSLWPKRGPKTTPLGTQESCSHAGAALYIQQSMVLQKDASAKPSGSATENVANGTRAQKGTPQSRPCGIQCRPRKHPCEISPVFCEGF